MAYKFKTGTPFLYDEVTDDIVGWRDPDGSEHLLGTSGAVFANAAAFQAALNAAAAQASVVEITAGITLHANTTYWVSMASAPASDADVFVNYQLAQPQYSRNILTGTYPTQDAGRPGMVLWSYDTAQQRLYVRGLTAVTHIAVVKYAEVRIAEGAAPGLITVPNGVRLRGAGATKSAVVATQALDTSMVGFKASYSIRVRSFCRIEDCSILNYGSYSAAAADFSTALLYPPDANADSVICTRVLVRNFSQKPGRKNSLDLASNMGSSGTQARGLIWEDCDLYGATNGLAIETASQGFKGWGTLVRCRTFGFNWLDGEENSFEHVMCEETNVLPSGEILSHGNEAFQGAILTSNLASFAGKPHTLRYAGSKIVKVRGGAGYPIAMTLGDDPAGCVFVFDGTTVQCDTGPVTSFFEALPPESLALYTVRGSSLPQFRVTGLTGTNRLPMGIRVQTTEPVNSSAGTASIAGFVVDNSKELSTDWEFTASFTGSFAANANNKRLVLQAGPVGALVDVLDMTSLAANGGNWEIQVKASRLGNIDGSATAHKWRVSATLISSNATVGTKVGVASGTVAVATNMQFSLQSTGVAAADIVLGLINVDGQN